MSEKFKKFEAKTKPEDVAKTYEASHHIQLEIMQKVLSEESNLWKKVKALCQQKGIFPMQIFSYYAYASQLYHLTAIFRGSTLEYQANLTAYKWFHNGLDLSLLVNIGLLFKLTITIPVEYANLYDLQDVEITNPLNDQVLTYDSILAKWKNLTLEMQHPKLDLLPSASLDQIGNVVYLKTDNHLYICIPL